MEEELCKKFAIKLKSIRESKKISKIKLATLAGCDVSYLGKIERCEKFPNIKMIAKLANALDVPVKDLFDF